SGVISHRAKEGRRSASDAFAPVTSCADRRHAALPGPPRTRVAPFALQLPSTVSVRWVSAPPDIPTGAPNLAGDGRRDSCCLVVGHGRPLGVAVGRERLCQARRVPARCLGVFGWAERFLPSPAWCAL